MSVGYPAQKLYVLAASLFLKGEGAEIVWVSRCPRRVFRTGATPVAPSHSRVAPVQNDTVAS